MKPSQLPSDEKASQNLVQRLKGLTVRLPENAGEFKKVFNKKYTFAANDLKVESISLMHESEEGETLVIRLGGVEERIMCGRGRWTDGQMAWGRMPLQPAAAAGGWTNAEFTAKICFYETPFIVTLRFRFSDGEVVLHSETNVGFGSTEHSDLVGKSE